MREVRLVGVAALILGVSAAGFAAHHEDLMAEVTAIGDALEAAMLANDAETMLAMYTEDAISLPNYGPRMQATDPPVVVEETFDAPIDEVWKALTEIERMRQWYFENIPDFKAEVGFETRFVVSNEGRDFPHRWRVTDVEPSKRIAYDWWYDGYPGDGFVVFELSQQGSSTALKLTQTIRETFPDEVPEFRRENCIAGWDYFLKDRLKRFLERSDR